MFSICSIGAMSIILRISPRHFLGTPHSKEIASMNEPQEPSRRRRYLILTFCAVFFCFCMGFARSVLLPTTISHQIHTRRPCQYPPPRREWRSLSQAEKQDYIEAVQCLRRLPSRIGMNQTLYHDFPWVHTTIGEYCLYPTRCPVSFNKTSLTSRTSRCCSFPKLASLLPPCL